jgi:CMP/dCMP kinase
MLIAIDGPAGAGKSTVARKLAETLGFTYLDTGAMYRCVALASLRHPERPAAELAREAGIELDGARVLLNGEDLSAAVRTPEVSQAASVVAADAGVREALVVKQQGLLAVGDWVAEGRDIATVVAPWAQVKVFLTASPEERARRRAAELGVAPEAVAPEQAERDARDSTREHGALRVAEGAVELDSTGLTLEQVVERIAALARAVREV